MSSEYYVILFDTDAGVTHISNWWANLFLMLGLHKVIRLCPVTVTLLHTVATQDISLSDSISAAIANPPSTRWEQKCAETQRSHVPYVQICTQYECHLSYSTATRLRRSRADSLGSCWGLVGVCDHSTPLLHNPHLHLQPRQSVYVSVCRCVRLSEWACVRQIFPESECTNVFFFFRQLRAGCMCCLLYCLLQVILMRAPPPEETWFKATVVRGCKYILSPCPFKSSRRHTRQVNPTHAQSKQYSAAEAECLVLSWLSPKGHAHWHYITCKYPRLCWSDIRDQQGWLMFVK